VEAEDPQAVEEEAEVEVGEDPQPVAEEAEEQPNRNSQRCTLTVQMEPSKEPPLPCSKVNEEKQNDSYSNSSCIEAPTSSMRR
jgi:hypothetical protein